MRAAKLALGMALVVTAAVGAGDTASGTRSELNHRVQTNEWARGNFKIVRHGWTVKVRVRLTDRKDGHCVYAKAELIVDPGHNPGPTRFGNRHGGDDRNNCEGNGGTTRDRVSLTPFWGLRYSTVKLWVCEDNAFGDDCTYAYEKVFQNEPRRPRHAQRILRVLDLPMGEFQRRKAQHAAPLDWSDNGCNGPIGNAPAGFKFRKACERHDFGYRNLGNGLAARPTDTARARVDRRFRADMRRWCRNHTYGDTRDDCYGWATTYFAAVRAGGGPAFFE